MTSLATSGELESSFQVSNGAAVTARGSSTLSNGELDSKTRKAKRIQFVCNGDRFSKIVTMAVAYEKYRNFDSLLNELTRVFSTNLNLPNGVRTLYSISGKKISGLQDLEDGSIYVCAGAGDQFKLVNYPSSLHVSKQCGSLKRCKSLTKVDGLAVHSEASSCKSLTHSNKSSAGSKSSRSGSFIVRPRIIILVRGGNRPRKVLRLLLNKRNAPSFEHALSTITDIVKLDTGAVRRVYNTKGLQVSDLRDFVADEEGVFFAYGGEKVNLNDFLLDSEELRAVHAQKRALRRPVVTELKDGTHYMDENGQRLPKLPATSKHQPVAKNSGADTTVGFGMPLPVLSRYTIGPVIGDGNFAVVRRCMDKLKGAEYALKVIDKAKVAGKEQMIQNEVSILRSVCHPNIIRLVAEYDAPSHLYLVVEFIRGGDLFDAITKYTKFSEFDAQVMTHDLACALSYLHERSIVHRDIKPENLLVEMAGRHVKQLKVADFGLAQLVTEPMYTVCGTPTYVAPEILAERGYGLKIDIWAAGVILYILLCGFPPFVSATNNQEELFDDILSGQYGFPSPYWDDVSDCAKDLISHMLQSNPELRFSAEDVLDHTWLES